MANQQKVSMFNFSVMRGGSNSEVQTQLVIASGLGFGSESNRHAAEGLCDEIGRMLVVIMRKLRQ